jgi:hypothetical protein
MGSVTTADGGTADITLPEGVYAAQVQFGDGVAFAASFAIDNDESCGVAIAFDTRREGLTSDVTGPA